MKTAPKTPISEGQQARRGPDPAPYVTVAVDRIDLMSSSGVVVPSTMETNADGGSVTFTPAVGSHTAAYTWVKAKHRRCRKGLHDMTPDNTYTNPSTGHHRCRACVKASKRKKGLSVRHRELVNFAQWLSYEFRGELLSPVDAISMVDEYQQLSADGSIDSLGVGPPTR